MYSWHYLTRSKANANAVRYMRWKLSWSKMPRQFSIYTANIIIDMNLTVVSWESTSLALNLYLNFFACFKDSSSRWGSSSSLHFRHIRRNPPPVRRYFSKRRRSLFESYFLALPCFSWSICWTTGRLRSILAFLYTSFCGVLVASLQWVQDGSGASGTRSFRSFLWLFWLPGLWLLHGLMRPRRFVHQHLRFSIC